MSKQLKIIGDSYTKIVEGGAIGMIVFIFVRELKRIGKDEWTRNFCIQNFLS